MAKSFEIQVNTTYCLSIFCLFVSLYVKDHKEGGWGYLITRIFEHDDIWPWGYLTMRMRIFDREDIWPWWYLTKKIFDQGYLTKGLVGPDKCSCLSACPRLSFAADSHTLSNEIPQHHTSTDTETNWSFLFDYRTQRVSEMMFKSYGQQLFSQGKCLVFYIVTLKE